MATSGAWVGFGMAEMNLLAVMDDVVMEGGRRLPAAARMCVCGGVCGHGGGDRGKKGERDARDAVVAVWFCGGCYICAAASGRVIRETAYNRRAHRKGLFWM